MSNPAIEVRDLKKSFGKKQAVRGVSFDVAENSIFGLIGANGAGKSSTIRMLLGLSRPDSGNSKVFGEDSMHMARSTRQRIGYLSEKGVEDHGLPLSGLLRYVSSFFPEWDWKRSEQLAERMNVAMDQTLSSMSVGERRRAELVLTLAHDPDLLVLDDPALGLDANVRREFLWAALDLARDEGKTILFTSHVLHDVERIVDSVAIVRDGEISVSSELDDLLARTKRIVFRDTMSTAQAPVAGELSREQRGRDLVVITDAFDDTLARQIHSAGPSNPSVENMNLEDIFCAVTNAEGGAR